MVKMFLNFFLVLIFSNSLLLLSGCGTTNHRELTQVPLSQLSSAADLEEVARNNGCLDALTQFFPWRVGKSLSIDEGESVLPFKRSANSKMDGMDPAHPASFKLISDGKTALASMVQMIREAKHTIDIGFYIWDSNSDAASIIIKELDDALQKNPKLVVQGFVDGLGSIKGAIKSFPEFQILVKRYGVERVKFTVGNPIFNIRANAKKFINFIRRLVGLKAKDFSPFTMLNRFHDKMILVDAEHPELSQMITGGRNIANYYFEIGDKNDLLKNFNDLTFYVRGMAYIGEETTGGKKQLKVFNTALEHFQRIFHFTSNKIFVDFIFKLSQKVLDEKWLKIEDAHAQYISNPEAVIGNALKALQARDEAGSDFWHRELDVGFLRFLDEFENMKSPLRSWFRGKEWGKDSFMGQIENMLTKAKNDIMIISPYIYMNDKEIQMLVAWLKQDPTRTFRVVTGSSSTSDNLFAQGIVEGIVMKKLFKKLDAEGISNSQVKINAFGNKDNIEFGGKEKQGKLHAKAMLIDRQFFAVGTHNFDPLSRRTNCEIMVTGFCVTDTEFVVKELENFYAKLVSQSTVWNTPEYIEMRNQQSIAKKVKIQEVIAWIFDRYNLLPQASESN